MNVSERSSEEGSNKPVTPQSVLVVDDDDSIRKLIRSVLRRDGYEIEEARNGLEAIEKIQERDFQAILLDLMMPVMSGFEVISFLKRERPQEKCIIVMSAASETRLQQVDRDSVYHLLRKPFDIHELSACVRNCIVNAPMTPNGNNEGV